MVHELKKLPYGKSDLEPYISANTIEFHYGKHHQAYVNNLNKLIEGTKFENATLEQIILEAEGPVFNNAAQVWNHTFYWEQFSPAPLTEPSGLLGELINKQFGSFEAFKEKFTTASATLFGSGWAWLALNSNGDLEIIQESNAGNPLTKGYKPILTCDVWEHAYYLDYQNRRPDYIQAFWKLLDFNKIGGRL